MLNTAINLGITLNTYKLSNTSLCCNIIVFQTSSWLQDVSKLNKSLNRTLFLTQLFFLIFSAAINRTSPITDKILRKQMMPLYFILFHNFTVRLCNIFRLLNVF